MTKYFVANLATKYFVETLATKFDTNALSQKLAPCYTNISDDFYGQKFVFNANFSWLKSNFLWNFAMKAIFVAKFIAN